MVLSEEDKARVWAAWGPVSKNAEDYGSEALTRMFAAHPPTKTYFPHLDLSPGSSDLKTLGKKVIDALTEAIKNPDDVPGALSKLSDLDVQEPRVDPVNVKLVAPNLEVTIAVQNRGPDKVDVILTFDKFVEEVIMVLVSRDR